VVILGAAKDPQPPDRAPSDGITKILRCAQDDSSFPWSLALLEGGRLTPQDDGTDGESLLSHRGVEVTTEWLQAFADAFNRHDDPSIRSTSAGSHLLAR